MSEDLHQSRPAGRQSGWFAGTVRRNSCHVLDWTSTGVVFARLQYQLGVWSVSDSDWESWPEHFDPFGDPRETAQLLQTWIAARPWAAPPEVISLPRQFVSLRLLSFPAVAPGELAELVSLQLESRQAGPDSSQIRDFLPHARDPAESQQHVSLLSAPAAVCGSIRRTVELAGWKLPRLTSADLFLGYVAPGETACRLAIQMNRSKLEVLAWRSGIPAASLACGVRTDAESALQGAFAIPALMERIVESLPEAWRLDLHSQPILVLGSRSDFLSEQLRNAGLPIISGPADERSPRAIAMARICHSRTPSVNLLRPRSASPSLYARRPAAVRSAVLMLLLLLAATSWILTERSSRSEQLQTLLKRTEQLQDRLSENQTLSEQRARLETWQAAAFNPATSLREFFEIVPADQRVLLTRIQLENITDDSQAVLTIDGFAQAPEDISELNTAVLRQPQRYLLRPYGIEPAPPESSLKLKFRTECVLLPQITTASDTSTDPEEQTEGPQEDLFVSESVSESSQALPFDAQYTSSSATAPANSPEPQP